MTENLLSIIMPVFNTGETLTETLHSVQCQSYSNWELICVDDGSTDEVTLRILDKFAKKDDRITLFHEENQGAAVARNFGLSKAVGDYIMFLDADDLYEQDLFELMLKSIELEAGIDMVECGCSFWDVESGQKTRMIMPHYSLYNGRSFSIDEITGHNPYEDTFTLPWNKIFSKSFLIDNKIEFQNIANSNDVYFSIMTFSLAGKIRYCISDKPLIYYRTNTGHQISSNRNPWNLWSAISYLMVDERLKKHKDQILQYLIPSAFTEILRCTNETTRVQFYKFLTEFLKLHREVISDALPEPYYNALINNSSDYHWISDKDEKFYREIDANLSISDIPEKDIVIWGNGHRSLALQRFLSERKVYSVKICDKNNDSVGLNTKYGYRIMSTENVDVSACIIASNTMVYGELTGKYMDVMDLQKFCP